MLEKLFKLSENHTDTEDRGFSGYYDIYDYGVYFGC